jgi:hypothetical protein
VSETTDLKWRGRFLTSILEEEGREDALHGVVGNEQHRHGAVARKDAPAVPGLGEHKRNQAQQVEPEAVTVQEQILHMGKFWSGRKMKCEKALCRWRTKQNDKRVLQPSLEIQLICIPSVENGYINPKHRPHS